jgi:hypothetical protein
MMSAVLKTDQETDCFAFFLVDYSACSRLFGNGNKCWERIMRRIQDRDSHSVRLMSARQRALRALFVIG